MLATFEVKEENYDDICVSGDDGDDGDDDDSDGGGQRVGTWVTSRTSLLPCGEARGHTSALQDGPAEYRLRKISAKFPTFTFQRYYKTL